MVVVVNNQRTVRTELNVQLHGVDIDLDGLYKSSQGVLRCQAGRPAVADHLHRPNRSSVRITMGGDCRTCLPGSDRRRKDKMDHCVSHC